MTVGALLECDALAACRVAAEHRVGTAGLILGLGSEGAGVAAFRIVGAADKGAESAELQREAALAAAGAEARVAPGSDFVFGKEMAAELSVERFEHRFDRQILGAGDRGRKIAPEIAQQLLPVDPPAVAGTKDLTIKSVLEALDAE